MMASTQMAPWSRDRLVSEYAVALRTYLAGGGETALSRAYELGRLAVANGVGVVEIALLHHAALSHVAPAGQAEAGDRAATFLAETLSPYEMTHRGFDEARTRLEQTNRVLQAKNDELVATARSLQEAKDASDAANGELEAFSYSVSHDLRAPLRSIDGFSQALLEDHAARLDEEGVQHLHRVRAAAQRMGQLIDDLLLLARVARTEAVLQPVDLSEIARAVADDLRSRDPEPPAVVTIEDGVAAAADSRLLRIVLENLLGNAWKFTAKRPERRIAFGVARGEPGFTFFVSDNGAGFNMAYAEKLFSAFQRLHSADEFPGTGIGLATVRRIAHRHGGRVWAKGVVGEGATVFFTLPADARAT